MFPELGVPSNGEYPTAASLQQNTALLGAQPTAQPQMQPMVGALNGSLPNAVQPQQPVQLGVNPHVDNMVKALQGGM